MIVLVNGLGNIGTTLCNLLIHFRKELGISRVIAYKNRPVPWQEQDLQLLEMQGVEVVRGNGSPISEATAFRQANYIFEATSNGFGLKNLPFYQTLKNLEGASAQGSEKGFGVPFITGVNDQKIPGEQFVNIVSCNTHSTATILQALCGPKLENLLDADVVVVRRSEDIGNHQRLVAANVVARHLDPVKGTHHGIDVIDTYESIGISPKLTTSDITTPSQMLHSARFNINLKSPVHDPEDLLRKHPMLSITNKFDSNFIFEAGRRYGFQGRIYEHAIIVMNNLLINPGNIRGWAFVPQEGNTLISTLHSFLLQTNSSQAANTIKLIRSKLLHREW